MFSVSFIKDFLMLTSILSLISVGFFIALKSGSVSVGGDHCRLLLGNFSNLVVTLAGCALFFLMIQQVVGFKLGAGW